MKLGYVGLGHMGGALARRLRVSHPLLVHDPSPAAMQSASAAGCTPADSLSALGSQCDVIFLCLPTSTHVESVLFDDGGLAESVKPGTLIIDQTTGDPAVTRALAERLAARDIRVIDAPVSGGAPGAEAGTIAIMVGAGDADFERALPILASISPNIFHVGDVGAGHVMKLVNNLLSGAQRLMTLEALTLAEKNGVTPENAHKVLLAGGAKNAYLDRIVGPHIIAGDLFVGFTLALQHKDLRLACQVGTASGVPLLLGNLAREIYQVCINDQGADAQVDTVALLLDRMAGTHVVPADPRTGPSE